MTQLSSLSVAEMSTNALNSQVDTSEEDDDFLIEKANWIKPDGIVRRTILEWIEDEQARSYFHLANIISCLI